MAVKSTSEILSILPVLPDEVITTHILPRLPIKSVGRFRCVSKPWQSLLSTQKFAKIHLKFHLHDSEDLTEAFCGLHILSLTGESAILRQVNYPNPIMWLQMMGSCNGLILLNAVNLNDQKILMNPITLDAVSLHESPDSRTLTYGLGYDSVTDDYKVISLASFENDLYERWVDVYSVKMKTWRRIGRSPYLHCDCEPGVFLNGRLHWLVLDPHTPKNQPFVAIASFDLAREKLEKIPLPSGVGYGETVHSFHIRVLGGRLTLMSKPFWSEGYIDVWVMEEYGAQGSWKKLTTMILPIKESGKPNANFRVCKLLKKDEIVVIKNCEQLLVYNWRNGFWRDMDVEGMDGGFFPTTMAFKESLISPNNI